MEVREKEQIRESVRENYGKIARDGGVSSETSEKSSYCGPFEIATDTSKQPSCCGSTGFSANNISAVMGYSKEDIGSVPEGANMGLGCGNPVALASLKPGETVVDLGSGGGFDCFLAAKEVGENGKVIGVDMTPDMVGKARKNAEKMGTNNIEFRLGEIEHLPVADNNADIIMSNCVINLSPDKASVYRDAYRVLKPGGRLAISDIVATAQLPDEIKKNLELVSACVGGAATIDETEDMLKQCGFQDIKITKKDESRALISEWAPSSNVGDYVVSAYIEAVKPVNH
ncbi:MAG: arsenite methyltransferase [Deltaproteobacteria bacterium]|nr:arsenite methyltransferase [Deltaproteobacteria bacterium]